MYMLNHWPRSPQQKTQFSNYVCEKHRDEATMTPGTGAANVKRCTSSSAETVDVAGDLLYVDQQPGDEDADNSVTASCRFCVAEEKLATDVVLAPATDQGKHHLLSVNLPVVNIDSENYMLRGVGAGLGESSRGRSYSFTNGANKTPSASNNYHAATAASKKVADERPVDMDMFCVRETASSLGNVADGSAASSTCARTLSFHALLCTCYMSCCCMCGSLCSPDCHACFHSLCVRFAANYACQRNNEILPPATLNHEKVRFPITIYFRFFSLLTSLHAQSLQLTS